MTNSKLLKDTLHKNGFIQKTLAPLLPISVTSLNYKINGKREFKSSEIKQLQHLLKLSDEQRDLIFFASDVEKYSTYSN